MSKHGNTNKICILGIFDSKLYFVNRRKQSDLHKAIIDGDVSKACSLVVQRSTLSPTIILLVIGCYQDMRKHPQGKNATPLHAAIHIGLVDVCRYLIEEGADVNWGYLDGMGPLCLALNHKHYDIAELLIDCGANVQVPDRFGTSPIYHAITPDSPVSIVKKILDKLGNTFNKTLPLIKAISILNVPLVNFFLKEKTDLNFVTEEGLTPLVVAISQGKKALEIVKLLIDHGANVEGLHLHDTPPLFLAVHSEDDLTALKMLIDAGADVNRIFTPFKYPLNPLPKPLISALELAACKCNFLATKILLDHGANVNMNVFLNVSILHLLFSLDISILEKKHKTNHRKIIQYVLENGADTCKKDFEGKLPVQCLFSSRNWIAVEEYIKFGGNLNKPICSENGSILRFTVCNKVENLVQLCLAYGADYFQKFKGESLYNEIIRMNCPNILKLFWRYSYPFDHVHLQEVHLNGSRTLSLLNTQLLFFNSIATSDSESLEKTIKQGAEVNCQSKLGIPLHICCTTGNIKLVRTLLENGAKISTVNSSGYTALHEAARAGHVDICKLLLRYGACLDSRGPAGVTPSQLAQIAGHNKVVDLIKNVSRNFFLIKKNLTSNIVNLMESMLGSEEFHTHMNCVNHRGNTLLAEALYLNLTDIAENLMSLRLKFKE